MEASNLTEGAHIARNVTAIAALEFGIAALFLWGPVWLRVAIALPAFLILWECVRPKGAHRSRRKGAAVREEAASVVGARTHRSRFDHPSGAPHVSEQTKRRREQRSRRGIASAARHREASPGAHHVHITEHWVHDAEALGWLRAWEESA